MPIGHFGGGVAHAIVGTLIMVGVSQALIGLPIGVGAGMFCAEYPPGSRLASVSGSSRT
ncbi:MAG: hypothetical protein R2882_10350 [Gemmatimonadales bacterium]